MAFFIYLAQASLYAAILWGIYCAVWRGKPLLRGSRIYLLCSMCLPLALPFIRLPLSEGSAAAAYRITLPEVVIGNTSAIKDGGFTWSAAAVWAYIACAIVLALLYLRSYVLLFRKLSQGTRQSCDGYTLITEAGIGPGTIGRQIFFPASEVNAAILRHELGHIRAGHRYDAALIQALHVALWASPAHWLMRRELKLVHEYEADRAAVTSESEQAAYGELMLSQSLGLRNTPVGHLFFHHPLKLRIKMLLAHQHPIHRFRTYATACIVLVLFSGVVVIAQTKNVKNTKPVSNSRKAVPAYDTIVMDDALTGEHKTVVTTKDNATVLPGGRLVYRVVGHMPAFNGDLSAWLSGNLVYPDAARKANQQGRSVVQFVVNNDGRVSDAEVVRSSGHPLLDKEALRAVTEMPHWKAGTQDGQAVAVFFTLPISFKLD